MESLKSKSEDWKEFVHREKYSIVKKVLAKLDPEKRDSSTPNHTDINFRTFYQRYLPVSAFTVETFDWALECLCNYASEYLKTESKGRHVYIDHIEGKIEKDPRGRTWDKEPMIQFTLLVKSEFFEDY